MKRIYLSGPMTRHTDLNFPGFHSITTHRHSVSDGRFT
jgi:hypothetical protein